MSQSDNAYLLDELSTPLVRYLSRRVSDADADDLAQEAFLRMHKVQQSSGLGNARAFLFKTANNLMVDQIRRERVHLRFINAEMPALADDDISEEGAPSAERTASAEEELTLLYAAMDNLPDKVRRAFLLHRQHDMSYAQIAKEMGVSTSMVEKYIVRALRLLRQQAG